MNKHESPCLLCGDIGGTKALLELFEPGPAGHRVILRDTRTSGDFPTFEALLTDFMKGTDRTVTAAAFSVAAPLRQGRGRFTNLPWQMDEAQAAQTLGIAPLRLINDFVAAATGIPDLAPDELIWVNLVPADPAGVRVVLGAGTGLGLGFATPLTDRSGFAAWPSEGGHADFAPRSEEEVEIWKWTGRAVRGRVGYERLLSGSGLTLLYVFYAAQLAGHAPEPGALEHITPMRVSEACHDGQDLAARRAVVKFLDLLGAFAGNTALAFLPTGGVYLAGGVITHLLREVASSPLLASYTDKGRLSEVVKQCPLAIVTNPELELMGARRTAIQLVGRADAPSSSS